MSALFDAVVTAFQPRQWHHHVVPGREVVESQFEAHHGKLGVHVQVFGDARLLSVVSMSPLNCPKTHRSRAAELIMRTNQELTLGSFEMVWDSGEVLFRVSNLFPEAQYPDSLVAALVHAAVGEMDRFTPFFGELCRTAANDLVLMSMSALMQRADLLPPEPEADPAVVVPFRDED